VFYAIHFAVGSDNIGGLGSPLVLVARRSRSPAAASCVAVAWRNAGPISRAGRALIAMTQQFTRFPSPAS
jgi:hypothetical protein